ncbi:MAG: type II toxin-antitoxin system RelE/ParE family toxin [Hyphomicrobiaceae bacterium]|nr:type II toxin-antitoxin system RelE/ParE family toxin [Hyphomicrobiaceae bacterium]
MQTVVETRAYLAAAKDAGIGDFGRRLIVDEVATNPEIGDLIRGTGGCRKFRIGGRGKGKSGGYRVITAFGGNDMPVFLLTVFGKGEKANLTKSECNELSNLTKVLFDTYAAKDTKTRQSK